jgi:L-cystine transport system permease protein
MIDFQYIQSLLPSLVTYLPVTLAVTFAGMVLGAILGLFNALVRIYRVPVLYQLSGAFISYVRGVPLLVQLLLTFYMLPRVLNLVLYGGETVLTSMTIPPLFTASLVFAIYGAGYLTEIFRGALNSVDNQQMEAAHSVGMTKLQAFYHIIFPQAVVIALPNYSNFFLSTLKQSSLAFCISAMDIMGYAKLQGEHNYKYIESYIAVTLVYLVLGCSFWTLFRVAEHLTKKNIIGSAAIKPLFSWRK